MQKSYSLEELQSKQFNDLSCENSRIFLLSLIHHLEDSWDNEPLRLQLIQLFLSCLQSSLLPKSLEKHDLKTLVSALHTKLSLKQFLSFAVPLERSLGGHLSEHLYVIDSQDRSKQKSRKNGSTPLFIIADNLRSAFNIGSIFRTGECLGAEHIYLCGYTADPEKPRTKKSAMGTEDLVAWSWQAKASNAIRSLQKKNIKCVALETAFPSTSMFEFTFPKNCALLLGNERYGLGAELLDLCDHTIHIPVYGQKNSLNVGVALAIAGYEYKRQHQLTKY
ncbi:MAG: RNA methyltransferase [Oligoflexales bacterium]